MDMIEAGADLDMMINKIVTEDYGIISTDKIDHAKTIALLPRHINRSYLC
jgi:hypothetical protein